MKAHEEVIPLETTVGFIGLGIMGMPMARNLIKAGFDLTVYNRTRSRTDGPVSAGARRADSPGDVASETNVVITMVSDTPDVEEIIRNALGLNETDSLKVVDTKFNRPVEIVESIEEGPNWPLYMAIAKQGSLGLMAICALIVLKIFSKGSKPTGMTLAASNLDQLSGGSSQMSLLPGDTGQTEQMMLLRQQIATAMQSNPDRAKQLFTSWVNQKGE